MSPTSGKAIREIKVAHSPDSDDAFMFYGMATNKVRVPDVKFTHTLCDIETLNRKALDAFYDITAISFHAYPYVQDSYAIMPSGGSMGEGYGPMIVASRKIAPEEIVKHKIAVPGTMTSAYLALKLFAPDIPTEVVPFDEIIPKVLEGKYEAGLIIHEGQLTFNKSGLYKVVDMGKWWRDKTGLPLPLGGNAIRRDLGPELIAACCGALRDSIRYALENREEALTVRRAVRPRSGAANDRQVCRHVCQRAYPGLRQGRPRSHRQVVGDGLRRRHHSPQTRVEFAVATTAIPC